MRRRERAKLERIEKGNGGRVTLDCCANKWMGISRKSTNGKKWKDGGTVFGTVLKKDCIVE